MNAHSKIDRSEAGDQFELIKPATGGARPFEIPPCAEDPNFERQPEGYAEQDLFEFEQVAKARGETFVRPTVQALAKRWKWSEGEVTEFLARLDTPKRLQIVPMPQKPQETDDGRCWALPRQDRIEVYATNEDTIEIVQISPMGESEDVRIDIARANAVALARRILFASGFSGLCLGGAVNGRGFYDLHDGSLPEHFDGFYQSEDDDAGGAE